MEEQGQRLKEDDILALGCIALGQNSGLTHSRTLLPMVRDLLNNCGTGLEQVDVIAVAVGPGSFTGLRIGVSTAKGLAWAEDKDCAPCSTLESMAWPLAFFRDAVIVCAMDARRKQVYNALFQADGERLIRLAPDRAISLEELGEVLGRYDGDGQREALAHTRAELSRALEQAREAREKQGRMYQVLGITAGAFLVILLL